MRRAITSTALVIAALLTTQGQRAQGAQDFYDICDQVRLLGYPCEHHNAQTADGFVLDLVRLPPKSQQSGAASARSLATNFKPTMPSDRPPLEALHQLPHNPLLNAPLGHPGLSHAHAQSKSIKGKKQPSKTNFGNMNANGAFSETLEQLARLQEAQQSGAAATNGTTPYPVVLQHGLIDSAVTFVANKLPSQNLACMLHDLGYDIWMPNSRGNHYSQYNIFFPTAADQNSTYFNLVDMDWMAKYDLPAVIDTVLHATGHRTLSWVGHSQGTWQAFSAFSHWHHDYAAMVDVFVAMAPVARIKHFQSGLIRILFDLDAAGILKFFGDKWFLVNDYLLRKLSPVCELIGGICDDLIGLLVGFGDMHNLDPDQFPTILRYDPGGTSVVNMVHWQQEAIHGHFGGHDYGKAINEKMFGSATPPIYDPREMVAPKTVLCAGGKDALADPQDVAWLKATMPNSTIVNENVIGDYDHMDFVWGLDAHTRLYPFVIQQIAKFKRN